MNRVHKALWCLGMRSVPVGQSIAVSRNTTIKVFLCNGPKCWFESISKTCFTSGEGSVPEISGRTFPCKAPFANVRAKQGRVLWRYKIGNKNLPDLNSTKAIFSNGKENKPISPLEHQTEFDCCATPHIPSSSIQSLFLQCFSVPHLFIKLFFLPVKNYL